VEASLWQKCLVRLENELPEQQFNTWIRPLHAEETPESLRLLAPNQFVLDWVRKHHFETISRTLHDIGPDLNTDVQLDIGSSKKAVETLQIPATGSTPAHAAAATAMPVQHKSNLNPDFTFESFVAGKSNQLAHAASMQVAENPGAINEFKRFYRTVDALLIDDIQFFAGKERSQEEFFHTFNALLEGQQQVILTCDRYPKEVHGLEERLKSRFGWGLTAAIEPAELETRVAILMSKAQQSHIDLPDDVAFFIAKRIQSNIRELEGALRRVVASARFTGRPISLDITREALRDLLVLQDKLVTIENIQKVVAEYYKIRVADLHSARRSRTITRPRQIAMALAKELTTHSLPEIGDAFGGRDHTTVLHATRKVAELRDSDLRINEDYNNLLRTLTT